MSGLSEFFLTLIGSTSDNDSGENNDGSEENAPERNNRSDTVRATDINPAFTLISQALELDNTDETEEEELTKRIGELLNQFDEIRIGVNDSGEFIESDDLKGKTTLILDPEQVPEDRRDAGQEVIPKLHEEVGGFSTPSMSPFVYSYRQSNGKEYIDQISEFYETKIPPVYVSMIEDSLMLALATKTQDLSWSEVRQRRRGIRDKYHNDAAFPLSSLCAAGYLDKGGLLYELYDEIVNKEEQSVDVYRDTFVKYVRNRPFVVFVKYDDTKEDIYDDFFAKLLRLDNYDREIKFIDIRGKGEENHEKIEEAVELIEEHHDPVQYDQMNIDRDLVIRIDVTQL